jgi:exosortase/archaeosortase family protein
MNKVLSIVIRYSIILLAGLGNIALFYKIFTPLTVYATAAVINLFTRATVSANTIITGSIIINLIPACIAGAAYYLLFILVLATPDIKPKKRLQIIILSFAALFVLNILRILILAAITTKPYFGIAHLTLWYVLSTIFVAAVWLTLVKAYRLKSIPVCSDVEYLYKSINKPVKKTKRRK